MFEFNSKLGVALVVDHFLSPWWFQNLLRECCLIFGSGVQWSRTHINRFGNEVANVLARIRYEGMNFIKFS